MKTNCVPRPQAVCRLMLIAFVLLFAISARGQWLTQSITLHPGWNAVYLHVNATNDTLENIVGPTSPISEIWLWQPSQAGRILTNPSQPVTGSDWMQWSKISGPTDAFPLRANWSYLVR